MLAVMWQDVLFTLISATKSPTLQLAVPLDLLYTGNTPSTGHRTADLPRGAVRSPGHVHDSPRDRRPGRRVGVRPRRPPHIVQWDWLPPATVSGCPWNHLPGRGFDMAGLRPHSPDFRTSLLGTQPSRYRNVPIHRIACCDVATSLRSDPFHVQNRPGLPFWELVKIPVHG